MDNLTFTVETVSRFVPIITPAQEKDYGKGCTRCHLELHKMPSCALKVIVCSATTLIDRGYGNNSSPTFVRSIPQP